MTVRDALAEARTALADHESDTKSLDAALLLSHVLGLSREQLYMRFPDSLSSRTVQEFRGLMSRRLDGEPVAWIVGEKEFWGRSFLVGPGVLTPRPDSEVLIEEALVLMDRISASHKGNKDLYLHDCCTGPGPLALTLARERPAWRISASDISEIAAGYFAQNNNRLCSGKVEYRHSDLMDQISGPFDIIVSNPPYLTPAETDERVRQGWKEPALALDGGGEDGLELIRALIPRAAARLRPGGGLLIEADPLQMPTMKKILVESGFSGASLRRDYGNLDRVMIARKD